MAFPFPNESYVNYGDADTLRTYSIERQFSSDTYSGTIAGTTSEEPVYMKLQLGSTILLGEMLEIYPTPFNPETTVRLAVREETHVTLWWATRWTVRPPRSPTTSVLTVTIQYASTGVR